MRILAFLLQNFYWECEYFVTIKVCMYVQYFKFVPINLLDWLVANKNRLKICCWQPAADRHKDRVKPKSDQPIINIPNLN